MDHDQKARLNFELSRWVAAIISVALIALLVAIVRPAFAHENEAPEPANAQVSEAMAECQTWAARAAWGANARFLGAKGEFEYMELDRLKTIFGEVLEGHLASMAKIPVAKRDDLTDAERMQAQGEYEKAAFAGWKQAGVWMADKRPNPGIFTLHAIFYGACMKATKEVDAQ